MEKKRYDWKEIAAEYGVEYSVEAARVWRKRVYQGGWPVERAVTEPIRERSPKKYDWKELAVEYGVEYSKEYAAAWCLRVYRYGWPVKKAVTEPIADNTSQYDTALLKLVQEMYPEYAVTGQDCICGFYPDVILWDEKILLEYDGHFSHYKNDGARDKWRDDILTKNGWRVIHFRKWKNDSDYFVTAEHIQDAMTHMRDDPDVLSWWFTRCTRHKTFLIEKFQIEF